MHKPEAEGGPLRRIRQALAHGRRGDRSETRSTRGASFRAIGYLPALVPADGEIDHERYAELRRTTGEDFSVAERLQYWSDVAASGIEPVDVRLLAIGGGRISAAEYRMALALGARVGAITGIGGAASERLRDPWWAATTRLTELAPEVDAVQEFLGP